MVLLALVATGLFTSNKMNEWKLGRAASETLRSVYSAQRMYLADNPMTPVINLTEAMLFPYLPNRNPAVTIGSLASAFETVRPIKGAALTFNVTVSPPQFTQAGVRYDPSGGFTDSLWDVGE